ncbi:MAG: multicopper oxidase domain-containing protein [Hyphomonadaceae bacterium]
MRNGSEAVLERIDMNYRVLVGLFGVAFSALSLASCSGGGDGGAATVPPIPSISAPPVNKAQMVSFTDTDMSPSEVGGDILITRASNESDVDGYRIRWGGSDNCTLSGGDLIANLSANGSDHTFTLVDNTMIPSGASTILVYTYNSDAEMDDCDNVSAPINDQQTTSTSNTITVMTYNVGFASAPSTATKGQLVSLMQNESADIIGFQELGSTNRSDIELGLQADYDFYDGQNSRNANPIALKKGVFNVLEDGAFQLSVDSCTSNYIVSYVRLQTSQGDEFVVFNDHFCRANPDHHAEQFIAAAKDIYPDLPLIFTGDLNSREDSSVMNYFLNQQDLNGQTSAIVFYDTWAQTDTGVTKSAAGAPIDWVLITDTNFMRVVGKSVVDDNSISDHDPVTATIELIESTQNLFSMPKILSGYMLNGKRVYDLTMQTGQTEIIDGQLTDTMGYNGSFFGPTLMMRQNDEVILNVNNQLIKASDNDRPLETTTHWHGFHIPAVMDGGPHQTIAPDTVWSPTFTVLNRAGFYWYHPHIMTEAGSDRTSGTSWQVWMGLAGQIIIQDDISDTLPIPNKLGVDDIPVTIQDRQFDTNGQFREPPYTDLGYVWTMRKGTTVLVNGVVTPKLQSHAQIIRLRLHNGSNARTFNFGFDDGRTFYQIASDGGFLENPVAMTRLVLGNAERAEILIDLSSDLGKEIVLRSFASELGQDYVPDGIDDTHDRIDYDIMTIAVGAATENAVMALPTLPLVTIDPIIEASAVNAANPRVFAMNVSGMTINGKQMDMARIDETITLGDTEVWEITNSTDNREQAHPFHIHGDSFQILSRERDGVVTLPAENERGWKDVVLVRPGEKVKIIKQFLDFSDPIYPYMYHCHILKHEDSGMMGQWVVVP